MSYRLHVVPPLSFILVAHCPSAPSCLSTRFWHSGSCVLGLRLDNRRLAVLRSRSLHIFGRGEGRAQPSTAHAPPGAADGAATMPSPQSAALQKALAQLEADTDGDW